MRTGWGLTKWPALAMWVTLTPVPPDEMMMLQREYRWRATATGEVVVRPIAVLIWVEVVLIWWIALLSMFVPCPVIDCRD